MVNGSHVGVKTATTIKITTTACRQYSMSRLREIRPILLPKIMMIGT